MQGGVESDDDEQTKKEKKAKAAFGGKGVGSAGGCGGLVPKTTAAAANSAEKRTGIKQESTVRDRSQVQGTLPPGAKSICIGADGTGGCRIEQNKIYWQSDEKDQLHFVNYPHGVGCKCCFRACIRGSDGSWVPLTLKQFPLQTSAVTAKKMILRRKAAGI